MERSIFRSSGKTVSPKIFQDEKRCKHFAHLHERRKKSGTGNVAPAEGDLKLLREAREDRWTQTFRQLQDLREPEELETETKDILSVINVQQVRVEA